MSTRDHVKDEERWEERFCPACGGRHQARVRPAYQFYPGDEQNEPALELMSLAAFGLWRRMLNIMHKAVPRGWLVTPNGKEITAEQLAKMVRETNTKLVKKLLAELEEGGVFGRTEQNIIYSRRMVRDEHISNVRAASGKKGGNPDLVNQDDTESLSKPPALLNQNGKQVPTPSPSTAPSSSPSPASAPSTATTKAPRSESSFNAASSSERAGGIPETVPPPRSALPAAAFLTPEKTNGNGNSRQSADPSARATRGKKLSPIALQFLDTYYAPGEASDDRRKDVRRGLTRLTLGAGDAYRGQLLHATDAQLRDAIQQLQEAWPIDNPDAAMPFILGCIADAQEVSADPPAPAPRGPHDEQPDSVRLKQMQERELEEDRQRYEQKIAEKKAAALAQQQADFPADWRSHARKTQPPLVIDMSPRVTYAEKAEQANRIAAEHPDWKEQAESRMRRLLPSASSDKDREREVVNELIAREEREKCEAVKT